MRTSSRLLPALALGALIGCGLGAKVDQLIEIADSETSRGCACEWQTANYASEQECFEDRRVTSAQRGCLEGTVDDAPNRESAERLLDCYTAAYDSLGSCSGGLDCTDDLSRFACALEFGVDVTDCGSEDPDLAADMLQCLGVGD